MTTNPTQATNPTQNTRAMKTTGSTMFEECNAGTADITQQLITEMDMMAKKMNGDAREKFDLEICFKMIAQHLITREVLLCLMPRN